MRLLTILSLFALATLVQSADLSAQEMTMNDYILGFLEEECGCFPGGQILAESKAECKALLAKTSLRGKNKITGKPVYEKMIYALIRHSQKIYAISAEQAENLRSIVPECPEP